MVLGFYVLPTLGSDSDRGAHHREGADTEFDPKVVAAFQQAFRQGNLEMWAAPLTAA
jgi:hypothetical protein